MARLSLLSLECDVISAIPDADTQLADLFTQYTKTDASAIIATQLQAVCDSLNVFNNANEGIYLKRIPTISRNTPMHLESEIPGISVSEVNKNYVVSLFFIRKFEQIGNLNFA